MSPQVTAKRLYLVPQHATTLTSRGTSSREVPGLAAAGHQQYHIASLRYFGPPAVSPSTTQYRAAPSEVSQALVPPEKKSKAAIIYITCTHMGARKEISESFATFSPSPPWVRKVLRSLQQNRGRFLYVHNFPVLPSTKAKILQ